MKQKRILQCQNQWNEEVIQLISRKKDEQTQASCNCSCFVTRREHEEATAQSMAVIVQGMLTVISQNNQGYVLPQAPTQMSTQMPVYNPIPIEILQQVANEILPPKRPIPSPARDTAPIREIPPSKENGPKSQSTKKEKSDHKEKKRKDDKKSSRETKEKKGGKTGAEKERKRKRTEPNKSEQREKSGHKEETKLEPYKDDQTMETEPKRKQPHAVYHSHPKKLRIAVLSDSDSE